MNTPADVLALIIARVESSNNPFAMRFEPRVEEHEQHLRLYGTLKDKEILRDIERANVCTEETAEVIYATSWGLYQIMGFNLYEQGWTKSIGMYLCNASAQTLSFTRFLQHMTIPFTWEELKGNSSALEHFATVYNGPNNVDQYMKRMLAAAEFLHV